MTTTDPPKGGTVGWGGVQTDESSVSIEVPGTDWALSVVWVHTPLPEVPTRDPTGTSSRLKVSLSVLRPRTPVTRATTVETTGSVVFGTRSLGVSRRDVLDSLKSKGGV